MRNRVLCFGSLNIDFTYSMDHIILKGETESSEKLEEFPGGKGLNQSIAFAKAGSEVYLAGAIGEDGRFLLDFLEKAGVRTDYVRILKGSRTGNAIIQKDKGGNNSIILYGGTNQMITKEQADDVLAGFAQGDYLILQNEISEIPYIMEKAHETGMTIVLNPSPMNEKIMRLPLQYVDIFLLNEIEGSQILAREPEKEINGQEMAAALHEKFPAAGILLTLGKEGSVYTDDGQTVSQRAYRVKTVDTTAAGDTFSGFFISGLMRGLAPREAMDLAARASAIAVTRHGAATSIPELGEVREFPGKPIQNFEL